MIINAEISSALEGSDWMAEENMIGKTFAQNSPTKNNPAKTIVEFDETMNNPNASKANTIFMIRKRLEE